MILPKGVSKQLEIKPNQAIATEVIWHVFGDDSSRTAPIVEWYSGDKLDCPGGHSFWSISGVSDYHQTRDCLLGLYVRSMHLAIVSYWGQPMSDTSLAHELCHAYFREANPHEICRDNGAPDDPVTRANQQLKLMGL